MCVLCVCVREVHVCVCEGGVCVCGDMNVGVIHFSS